ncbi:MAG: RtcB family protein [Nitrospirae bacterium]|nr:RtcB family protein [Nitrospirota bacterium]
MHPLIQLDDYRWEIPTSFQAGMRVPGIIFASKTLVEAIIRDKAYEQVANTACLPGIVKAAYAMPDIHFGYGFPIGGVVATDVRSGVVSPGGVGFDINCGVRLVATRLRREEIAPKVPALIDALYRAVPTGVGSEGALKLSPEEERSVLRRGARWVVERGMGTADDLAHTEAGGCLADADPDAVSAKAYERGRRQLGTVGSGNHFIELQYVDRIYDETVAAVLGLTEGLVTLMIHSGSRGLGHQVCTDYLATMDRVMARYGIELPDRQLACVPIASPEGRAYLGAMRAAANFAWANRQCLMHRSEETLLQALNASPRDAGFRLIYDVAHNIVKIEDHVVDGQTRRLAVHRKGATRAFPPHHPELPPDYQEIGQPVIIPGDMGRYSFLLTGTAHGMAEAFGSSCHGAGRMMSRSAALKATRGRAVADELRRQGVTVRGATMNTVREEVPEAYKDVAEVVDVVAHAGIAAIVARLKPMGVIKG